MWLKSPSPFQIYRGLSCDWSFYLHSRYIVICHVTEVSIFIPDIQWSPMWLKSLFPFQIYICHSCDWSLYFHSRYIGSLMWLKSLSPFQIYSGLPCDWSLHLHSRYIGVSHVIEVSIPIPDILWSAMWLKSPSLMLLKSVSPFQIYSGLPCDWSLHLHSRYTVVTHVIEVSISIPDI